MPEAHVDVCGRASTDIVEVVDVYNDVSSPVYEPNHPKVLVEEPQGLAVALIARRR